MASTLKKSIERPDDFVARYGGEEFIITLPNKTISENQIIMEKIRASIETLNIPHTSKASAYLTLSVGIATVIPRSDIKCDELIYQADMALYQSKLAGRNQVSTSEQLCT